MEYSKESFWRDNLAEKIRLLIEKDHEINAYGVYLYIKNGPFND
jgi:hypothetical protein